MTTKHQDTRRNWVVHNGTIQHKIGHVIIDECEFLDSGYHQIVVDMLNKAYQIGRQDEFSDNLQRGTDLSEKYGV